MTFRPLFNRRTPLDDLPELIKISEAAHWLAVSEGVLYSEVKRGALAAVRIGRLIRIHRDELRRYMAKDRQGAA